MPVVYFLNFSIKFLFVFHLSNEETNPETIQQLLHSQDKLNPNRCLIQNYCIVQSRFNIHLLTGVVSLLHKSISAVI